MLCLIPNYFLYRLVPFFCLSLSSSLLLYYFVVFPLLIHFYLFLRHLDCLRYTNSCNSPRCIDTITTNQYSMPHLLLIYSCLRLQYNLRWSLLPLLHGRYVHIQSAQCHSQSLLLSHFIVVSYIEPIVRLPIIQPRLIVTSSDILYKLLIHVANEMTTFYTCT